MPNFDILQDKIKELLIENRFKIFCNTSTNKSVEITFLSYNIDKIYGNNRNLFCENYTNPYNLKYKYRMAINLINNIIYYLIFDKSESNYDFIHPLRKLKHEIYYILNYYLYNPLTYETEIQKYIASENNLKSKTRDITSNETLVDLSIESLSTSSFSNNGIVSNDDDKKMDVNKKSTSEYTLNEEKL